MVKQGSRTPWGKADHVKMIVPGVFEVGTPGHGGIKLDPVRNKLVPASVRRKAGWYEEDCEVSIVFATHRDVRSHFKVDEDQNAVSLASWLPRDYVALRDGGYLRPNTKAEERLAEHEAERLKKAHAVANRIPVRCSAMHAGPGRVHVLFNVPNERETVGYFMSDATYGAIPLGVTATPDDYRAHGTLEPAPASF